MRATRAVAVAAVACIAAASACTTTTTASQPPLVTLPTGAALPPPDRMPAYYVVVTGLDIVVRASGDGHMTGSVRVPGVPANERVNVTVEAFGGAGDRHFVILVARGGDLPGVASVTLFLLTVSPQGRPGRLRQLNVNTRGEPVTGVALSPDAKLVALSLTHEFLPPLFGSVELINLLTGATRTWTAQAAPGYWPGIPAWAGSSTVIVPWWHDTGDGMIPADLTGVRELDIAAPGTSLLAAPLVAFAAPVQGLESAVIAPDGGDVVASSCRAEHHTATAQVIELSAGDPGLVTHEPRHAGPVTHEPYGAAAGRPVRVLRMQTARFPNDADAQDAVFSQCQVLSVASPAQVLVQAFALGRVDNGSFTPLPGISPDVLPVSAAW